MPHQSRSRQQAGGGLHYSFEGAGDLLPGKVGGDHSGGGLGEAGAEFGSGEEFQALGGEVGGGIGEADVVRGIDGEALGADGGGDDRDLSGHGFVDLQTGAAADAQGDDGDGGIPKIGTNVRDGAGDVDAGVGDGELGDFRRGRAADDGEGGFALGVITTILVMNH